MLDKKHIAKAYHIGLDIYFHDRARDMTDIIRPLW